MASKPTGKAASVARRAAAKKNQTSLSTATKQPTTGRIDLTVGDGAAVVGSGSGGGASSALKNLSVSLASNKNSPTTTSKTGPSPALKNLSVSLAKDYSQKQSSDKRQAQRRDRLNKNNRLSSDNLRASQTDTTLGESVTAKGARSTRGISDKEVDDLAKQGFREGDFVPGRGVLLPDGTFDTKRLDELSNIQSEAENIQTMLNTLKGREKTAAATGIATDTPEVKEEESATNSIADAIKENPMSKTMALLDEQIKLIREQAKLDERNINADYKQSRTDTQGAQTSETGQTSVALAQAGGYLGTSGSAQGVMLKLAESHRAELTKLDIQRQKAIAEARKAAANREFDVVREKQRMVEKIEQDAYERELDYQEKVQEAETKRAEEEAEMQTEKDIMTAFTSGASTPEAVFTKLGGVVPAKKITEFLTNITKDIGGDDNVFKFSATQNAALLGSGMAMDDIKALNEYVMENGYTDTVRVALTPSQRVAADKIFRTGPVGSGTSSGFTSQEKRKLEQAGLLEAPRQDQLDFLYGDEEEAPYKSIYTGQIVEGQINLEDLDGAAREEAEKELTALGFDSEAVPQWFADYVTSNEAAPSNIPSLQAISGGTVKSKWENYRRAALGQASIQEETKNKSVWSSLFGGN